MSDLERSLDDLIGGHSSVSMVTSSVIVYLCFLSVTHRNWVSTDT